MEYRQRSAAAAFARDPNVQTIIGLHRRDRRGSATADTDPLALPRSAAPVHNRNLQRCPLCLRGQRALPRYKRHPPDLQRQRRVGLGHEADPRGIGGLADPIDPDPAGAGRTTDRQHGQRTDDRVQRQSVAH